jgi:hypothetical protein
MAAQF